MIGAVINASLRMFSLCMTRAFCPTARRLGKLVLQEVLSAVVAVGSATVAVASVAVASGPMVTGTGVGIVASGVGVFVAAAVGVAEGAVDGEGTSAV